MLKLRDRARAYEIPDYVKFYAGLSSLMKPEEIILDRFRDQWPLMNILDIGVGGGRTTLHFGGLAKEYVGIDFDENMLRACTERFPNRPAHVSFMWGDARSMTMFCDASFDFILFSYQGIDYLPHDERLQALREIRRVSKDGGYFFFSTHNLNAIDRVFAVPYSDSRLGRLRALLKHRIMKLRNEPIERLKAKSYAAIYNGTYSDTLRWLWSSVWRHLGFNYYVWRHLGFDYYIKPDEQVKQLRDIGFSVIGVYGSDGRAMLADPDLSADTDYHHHYLCQSKSLETVEANLRFIR